ncbi:MAG: BamA/TamA family outer membrane protein, partial [Bacteroidota bacterium]|nr:BamA/TamA family outer membrane protein [Bacteroidota bacterium]
PNPFINDGNVNSVVFSAGLTTLASLDERSHGWDAQLQYEMAGGFAAGDFEFTQIIADVRRYQPLSEHLNLNLRARAGMSDGLLPQQRGFELGGPGTLPGYRFKEFAGSHVALLSTEFIVRSSIVGNARGWAKNLLRNTNIIFFANAGSTNGAQSLLGDVTDVTRGAMDVELGNDFVLDTWKSDIGVALGSADGDFRIGAAWRLDREDAPNFVIRFSRPF